MLDKFLEDSDNSQLAPVPVKVPDLADAPGPVALSKPAATLN
jgi:hypothetical protein